MLTQGQQVFGNHHDLLAHSGGGLGVGGAAHITQAEDVRVVQVLQGMGVHFAPTGGVGQRALADEVRGDLGGTTCNRSKDFSSTVGLPSASFTANQALRAGPSTFTRLELNARRALYFSTYFISGGTKVATPNSATPARLNSDVNVVQDGPA